MVQTLVKICRVREILCLFSRILVGRKSVNSAGYCICHSPALQPFVQFPAAHLCTPESFDLNLLQLKIPLPDPTEFTCSLYYSRDLDYSPENFSFLSNKFKFVNTLAWYQPHLWDCSSPSLVIPLLAWLALIRFQKRMNIQYVSLLAYQLSTNLLDISYIGGGESLSFHNWGC